MRRELIVAGICLGLSGCASPGPFGISVGPSETAEPVSTRPAERPAPGTDASAPTTGAGTAEDLDTTSAAERAAAAAPAPVLDDRLGTTIASLGDPTDPGFWAETPLVNAPTPGRLEFPGTGQSVQVELRPPSAEGGGTRVSLPALRVLGAPLTGLPELTVYGPS